MPHPVSSTPPPSAKATPAPSVLLLVARRYRRQPAHTRVGCRMGLGRWPWRYRPHLRRRLLPVLSITSSGSTCDEHLKPLTRRRHPDERRRGFPARRHRPQPPRHLHPARRLNGRQRHLHGAPHKFMHTAEPETAPRTRPSARSSAKPSQVRNGLRHDAVRYHRRTVATRSSSSVTYCEMVQSRSDIRDGRLGNTMGS